MTDQMHIFFLPVVMHKDKDENGMLSHIHSHEAYRSRELGILEHSLLDGDMFLQVSNRLWKVYLNARWETQPYTASERGLHQKRRR